MQRFANPGQFQRLARAVQPWTTALAALCLIAGLWFALVASPRDYQQGETVRIMYVHVPAAWMAMFAYTNLAVAAAVLLVWKHPLAELAGRAMAATSAPAPKGRCSIAGTYHGAARCLSPS